MKKSFFILSLCAVMGLLWLCGCSKAKGPVTRPESQANSTSNDAAATDRPVDMRIKWAAGKKYAMRLEFNQGSDTKVPNLPDPVKQEVKMGQDLNLRVLQQLADGGWQLEMQFENQTLEVSVGGRNVMNFDSAQNTAQDTNNPAAPILRAMVGTRIEYFTDTNGQVQKLEGVDELMNKLAAISSPQQLGMFRQMYSEDTLKRYGSFSDAMPNRVVQVGESWSNTKDIVSAIGTLTLKMNYTFKNWEQHGERMCAHVDATGDITSKTVSAATVGAAVEIEKGKVSGVFWFDPDLGMTVDMNSDQDMTLKITTRQQSFKQQLTQKIRMTVLDI